MYQKVKKGWLKHLDFELMDLVCIEIAFFIAYLIRHSGMIEDTKDWYIRLGVIMLLIQCVVVFFINDYKGILHRNAWLEFIAVIKHVTVIEAVFIVYEFIMKETDLLSRYVILVSWGLSVIFCYIGRLSLKVFLRSYITDSRHQAKMLVLTDKSRVETTMRKILSKPIREYRVTAIAFAKSQQEEIEGAEKPKLDLIYGEDSFWEYVRTNVVDEVFIDTFQNIDSLNQMIEELLSMGITVHIGMEFMTEDMPNQLVEKVGACSVITTTIKTAEPWQITVKRLMDIVGSIIGLIIMAIAYVFIAPIIKKESPGPVFFKQQRVGRNGRIFNIYKFRSMNLDAEEYQEELQQKNEMQGLMFKIEDDPRIIGYSKGKDKSIGYFIRRTSIDELPQFWNVLKGEMSLVGTRPPTLKEYEQYDRHHKIRLSMKPGITGMWQANGRSNISDFEEIVKLDTKYIENWSLGLDVKLIFKTVIVVLGRIGAK